MRRAMTLAGPLTKVEEVEKVKEVFLLQPSQTRATVVLEANIVDADGMRLAFGTISGYWDTDGSLMSFNGQVQFEVTHSGTPHAVLYDLPLPGRVHVIRVNMGPVPPVRQSIDTITLDYRTNGGRIIAVGQ